MHPRSFACATQERPFGTGNGEEFAIAEQLLHSPNRNAEQAGYIGE